MLNKIKNQFDKYKKYAKIPKKLIYISKSSLISITKPLCRIYRENKRISKIFFKISPIIVLLLIIFFNMLFIDKTPTLLTLSSGSPGGAYYPLGGGMAEIITRNIEDVRMDSESTSASVENIRLVGNNDSDLGMAMESAVYKGIEGIDPFSSSYPIKVLFNMYSSPLHIVTLKDSNIDSIEDMSGKTVSIGAPGSGAEQMARTVLKELNLLEDINTENYGQQEAAAALKDGNIDAVFWNFAYPGSVVLEVSATRDIKFIPLKEEDMNKVIKNHSYFMKDIIPSGIYDKQKEDIPVLSVNNLIIVNEDMDESLAYEILKAIFDKRNRLEEIHDVARYIDIENATKTSIELHPGAIKYFNEHSNLKEDD